MGQTPIWLDIVKALTSSCADHQGYEQARDFRHVQEHEASIHNGLVGFTVAGFDGATACKDQAIVSRRRAGAMGVPSHKVPSLMTIP